MNILITSVGRRSYMIDYFKNALEGKGKVYASNNILTFALTCADDYVLSPSIYDEEYIAFLLDFCIRKEIGAVISLFDIDLPVLAANKQRFKNEGIEVIVSDSEIIEICNDKWKTYLFLKKNSFRTPLTYLDVESVKHAIRNKELNYPLFIKPRWGMGSIGIFEADNEEELIVLYNKTKNIINQTYLKYESELDYENSIVIQEKLTGEEWGLDVFNNLHGEYLACVPKRKLAMRAGETDVAITSKRKDLIKLGVKVSRCTEHIGNLDLDFFIQENELFILELNCRFGGQYPFAHLSGVNFPKALVQMLLGEKPNEKYLTFKETKSFKDFEIRKV